MSKETIISFLLGAVIMTTGYLGFVFYKQIVLNNQQQITLQEIVNYLNASIEAQKKAQEVK